MKKFKMRKTTVRFDVFEYPVHIVETTDFNKVKDKLRISCCSETRPSVIALTFNASDGSGSFMLFKSKPSMAAIVHESWHAISSMLKQRGAELDDEVVAYHLDYLVGKACKFLGKE